MTTNDLFDLALHLRPELREDFLRARAPESVCAELVGEVAAFAANPQMKDANPHWGTGRELIADRFLVIGSGARGAFATVHYALDLQVNYREVALKLYREDTEKFWERERKILDTIASPVFVKKFADGMHGKRPYLVMEWLQRSLGEAHELRGNARSLGRLLVAIADAITVLHEQKFSHLDIKEANIRVREPDQPVLVDFNISQPIRPGGEQTSAFGTRGAAAPEQFTKKAGPKSDGYSFAVLTIGLLRGEPYSLEFDEAKPVRREAERAMASARIPISWPVRRIFSRLVEPDPANRTLAVPFMARLLAFDLRVKPFAGRKILSAAGLLALGALTWSIWPTPTPKGAAPVRIQVDGNGTAIAANTPVRLFLLSRGGQGEWRGPTGGGVVLLANETIQVAGKESAPNCLLLVPADEELTLLPGAWQAAYWTAIKANLGVQEHPLAEPVNGLPALRCSAR